MILLCSAQEIVTHQLCLEDTVKGIQLVLDSKKSIKVVILPNHAEI